MLSFLVSLLYSEELLFVLTKPLFSVSLEQTDLVNRRFIFTDITEVFTTYIRISFGLALLLQIPITLYQFWLFVEPGLYQKEQTFLRILFIGSILFLAIGISFLYFIVMPAAWNFFLTYEKNALDSVFQLQLEAKVNEYLSLVMKLIFAFGLSFQLPVVLSLLARIGVVNSTFLKERRKYVVVIIFAAAAVLTPPDPITQIGLGIPLLILYELSIISVGIIEKKAAEKNAQY